MLQQSQWSHFFLKFFVVCVLVLLYLGYNQVVPVHDGQDYYYLTRNFSKGQFDNKYYSPEKGQTQSPYPPGGPVLFSLTYRVLRVLPFLSRYDNTPLVLQQDDYRQILKTDSYSLPLGILLAGKSHRQYNDLTLLSVFLVSLTFFILGIIFSIKTVHLYWQKQELFWLLLLLLVNPVIFFNIAYLFNWVTFIVFGLYAVALYVFLMIEKESRPFGVWLGLVLGGLFLVRYEFVVLFAGLFSYYCFFCQGKRALSFQLLLGFLPFLVVLGVYNYQCFDQILAVSYFAVRKKAQFAINFKDIYTLFFDFRSGLFWYDFVVLSGLVGACRLAHIKQPSLRPFFWASVAVGFTYVFRNTGDPVYTILLFAGTRYAIPFLPLSLLGIVFIQEKRPGLIWLLVLIAVGTLLIFPAGRYVHRGLSSAEFTAALQSRHFFEDKYTKRILQNDEYFVVPQANSVSGFIFCKNQTTAVVRAVKVRVWQNSFIISEIHPVQTPGYYEELLLTQR